MDWYALAEDQADFSHNAAYYGQAVFDKNGAGTVTKRFGTAVPELWDAAADITCDITASTDAIIVTFATTTAAKTINAKVWACVRKISTAAFTGVAYPMAA